MLPGKWRTHIYIYIYHANGSATQGENYTAANGGKFFNRDEKTVTMVRRELHLRNMKFTSCGAKCALGAVSAVCKQGHTVLFNAPDRPDSSYVFHMKSGERIELKHRDEVFVLDTKVAPKTKQVQPSTTPGRRALRSRAGAVKVL